LLACEAAFAVTGKSRYRDAMERAYAWFLGANDLRVRIASPVRGASGDGLTPLGRNTNEGAESTLMWLMAVEHIRAVRALEASATSPVVALLPGPSTGAIALGAGTSPVRPVRPTATRATAPARKGSIQPSMQPSIQPSETQR
jgi:hypothetical protein